MNFAGDKFVEQFTNLFKAFDKVYCLHFLNYYTSQDTLKVVVVHIH